MSIGAPATNPASDLELKLPATIGTAGQVLKNSSTPGTLEFGSAGAGNAKITRVGQGTLTGADSYTYTGLPSGIVQFSFMWYSASPDGSNAILARIGAGGSTSTSGYYNAQAEIGDGSSAVTRSPRTGEIPIATDSWEGAPAKSQGRLDGVLAHGDIWTWKMQNYYRATSSSHYVNMLNTGYVDIGGALERVVLFLSGGDFDSGNVYLTYTQIV